MAHMQSRCEISPTILRCQHLRRKIQVMDHIHWTKLIIIRQALFKMNYASNSTTCTYYDNMILLTGTIIWRSRVLYITAEREEKHSEVKVNKRLQKRAKLSLAIRKSHGQVNDKTLLLSFISKLYGRARTM